MKAFGISNFRSFDDDGVLLDNLSKINIIIGKNNCGKSNVLRFLQLLNSNINSLSNFPNDIINQHKRNGKQATFLIKLKGNEFISNENGVRITNQFFAQKDTEFVLKFDLLSQTVEIPDVINKLSSEEIFQMQGKYINGQRSDFLNVIKENINQKVKKQIHSYFNDLIYIPHLRVIQEGHTLGDSNSSINGANIISKMFEMQNPIIGDEKSRNKFNLIRSFVRVLINKDDLEIEIPHTKESIVLTIDGNRLHLESFGTGIHQLVIMCSALVIHENSIVCIEEPEIHLHPELQRKFLDFLSQTKNIYFLTTHSNVFLDARYDTSIYHVENDGIKSSIFLADHNKKTHSILNDLGYHSSDILQANGVIWVEGPSDRTYILRWISIIDSTLEEGLHFIIMFYGGRLLSNLSFANEKVATELIPLLHLNRNAFVVMDRDGFSSQVKLNQTKQRIKTEIGDKSSWITKGREIENYMSSNLLSKWTGTKITGWTSDKKIDDVVSNKKYEQNKSKYAKELVTHFELEDIEHLDLKMKINQLVKKIISWNQ